MNMYLTKLWRHCRFDHWTPENVMLEDVIGRWCDWRISGLGRRSHFNAHRATASPPSDDTIDRMHDRTMLLESATHMLSCQPMFFASSNLTAQRLVEQTEAHVLVGLLLLLFLLLGLWSLLGGTGSGSSTASSWSSGTTRWDGCELGSTLGDQLSYAVSKRAHPLAESACGAWGRTSLMSLPSSSLMSWLRRSSSASMPTAERTSLTSAADGEALPPRPRRRYAAKCFILAGV